MEETQRVPRVEPGVAMEAVMAAPSHPIHLFEKQPANLDTDSSGSSLSSTHPEVLTAAAYANFVHMDANVVEEALIPSPVGILLLATASKFNDGYSLNMSSPAEAVVLGHREREPRFDSSDIFKAIPSPVQEPGPSRMSTLSNGDVEEAQGRANEVPDGLRASICDHPLYPEMVDAHIGILKIGAPKELQAKLDDVTNNFRRCNEGGRDFSKLGQDPELDHFMKSYAFLLSTFQKDLQEPFDEFTQFIDKTTKELEGLCGHSVEIKPVEENFGYGTRDGDQDSDDDGDSGSAHVVLPGEEESTLVPCPADVDESVVLVDPEASEEELKKELKRKYGRQIGALKAEFNRVRKKGKLPDAARRILKNWFNLHSHWPYPSEMEKTYLQRLCNLTLKQVNNWFINERKRHWNSEERSVLTDSQFNYDDDAPREGAGFLEHS